MTVELILFLILGAVAVVCAVGMLVSKNAVYSAVFLILNFASVAILFLSLNAPFLSMVQIAVYAGAIMVLFLFVIMLLGAERTTDTTRNFPWIFVVVVILAFAFLVVVGTPLTSLGNFRLPETDGSQPLLRVVNAVSDTPESVVAYDVYLNGELLTEDALFYEDTYPHGGDDAASYIIAEEGEHTISFNVSEQGNAAAEFTFELAAGDVKTVVLYGTAPAGLQVMGVDTTVDSIPEGEGRFSLLNLYNQESLLLVDLGPNRQLDIRTMTKVVDGEAVLVARTQSNVTPVFDDEGNPVYFEALDADGNPMVNEVGLPLYYSPALNESGEATLDEDGNPIFETSVEDVIVDTVLLNAEPGVISESDTYSEGTYYLGLVHVTESGGFEVLREFKDFEVTAGLDELLILGFDEVGERLAFAARGSLAVEANYSFGGPHAIGQVLFTDYMLPVQLVGVLLLVGLVGVVVLTRPERSQTAARRRREKVSRPLVSVISSQTGQDVVSGTPQLDEPAGD